MITPEQVKDNITLVKPTTISVKQHPSALDQNNPQIKVEIKRIQRSISMINRHNRTTRRILGNAITIGLCTIKPSRKGLYAFVWSEINAGVAEIIELIEIVEGERGGVTGDFGVV